MNKLKYLPSLDGIRAICIVLVLGGHAVYSDGFPSNWKHLWAYFFNGTLGVLIFFVLSGFLITYLLAQEEEETDKISLKSFYIRRFIRIFPVYYFYIFVITVLDFTTALELSGCQYLTMLAYVKNFGCMDWIEGHLWSLSVEEQFYLLWPLILVFFPKNWRWYAAISLIIIAPLFRVWFYIQDQGNLYNFSFMTNMDSLLIGCFAALLSNRHYEKVKKVVSWHPTVFRVMAVLLIYTVLVLRNNHVFGIFTVTLGNTVQAIAAVYLIVSYVIIERGVGYRFLNYKYIRHLGVLSYSIYIWQQPFIVKSATFGFDSILVLTFPFNIIASILVAMLSYHILEMPFLKLRKRFRTGEKLEESIVVKSKREIQTVLIH